MKIIRRSALRGAVVIADQQTNRKRGRPFVTFAVTGTSRYAQHIDDFASEAEALQAHDAMVVKMTTASRRGR